MEVLMSQPNFAQEKSIKIYEKTSEHSSYQDSLLFIRDLAIMLRLSQQCVATAQFYFNSANISFFSISSDISSYDSLLLATSCLFIAGKALEQPRHLELFCKVFYDRRSAIQIGKNSRLQIPPMSKAMLEKFKQSIIYYEFIILNTIGFSTYIPLPYSYITNFVNLTDLDVKTKDSLLRCANSFANDSFRSLVALKKNAENIGRACIFLASKYLQIETTISADPETINFILEWYNN
ncbi:unnamed protein product [Blepharisma stoltei]|uniref:Cyclin-like domain-containing protein n=1 Tax=Blepharisma stoltei TaxID=1481888 RepID=A0AAU9ISJ1_9CILI|nr:unnamed protein product [Blepharisma stoltei]